MTCDLRDSFARLYYIHPGKIVNTNFSGLKTITPVTIAAWTLSVSSESKDPRSSASAKKPLLPSTVWLVDGDFQTISERFGTTGADALLARNRASGTMETHVHPKR